MTERPLYDVVPEWSPERKEAFALYRDFGAERSLRAVAQQLGKSAELIERWSRQDGWRVRVAAWDAECDRVKQEAAREELERLARKHARAIESTITVLMQPAVKLADQIENEGEQFLADLTPIELANLAAIAGKQLPALVQASRLIHGKSTENIDVKSEHRVKIESATPDELDAYLLGVDDGSQKLLEQGNDG